MSDQSPKPFAIEWVENAPHGAEIYLILRHVSQSGMSRVIDMVVFRNGQPRYLHSLADDPRFTFRYDSRRDGFKVQGAGMDMGFHLVYSLGQSFKGDGYYFTHRWL